MNNATLIYNQKHIEKMKKLCAPLERYFGINSFNYHKLYKDSRYFILYSDLEMAQEALAFKSCSIFFKRYLYNIKDTYFILWPEEPQSINMEAWFRHNYWNGISILKSSKDYVELWSFTSQKENNILQSFYSKNFNVLYSFANYFDKEMLAEKNEGELNLALMKNGIIFDLPDPIAELSQEQKNVKEFLAHIFPRGLDVKAKHGVVKLTPAEIGCLQLLAKNNSVKEIARKLDISNRTVEKHIDNIKDKTGYRLRSDMTSLFHDQVEKLTVS